MSDRRVIEHIAKGNHADEVVGVDDETSRGDHGEGVGVCGVWRGLGMIRSRK